MLLTGWYIVSEERSVVMTPTSFQPQSQTLPSLVEEMACLYPDHPFLIETNRSLTYAAFRTEVEVYARGLMSLGIQPGDPVAILMGNRLEWLIADFAICSIGGVMVGLNTWVTAPELAYLLGHSGSRALITSGTYLKSNYLEMLGQIRSDDPQALSALQFVVLTDDAPQAPETVRWSELKALSNRVAPAVWREAAARVQPTDMCYLLYTSGSTARPKGVLLQHAPMIENMWHIGQRQHVRSTDRLWLAVSLFWGLGCENALFNVMTHGASLVLQEHFDAETAVNLIHEEACTLFYGTPNMATALMGAAAYKTRGLSKMRGGATIGSPEQIQRLVDAGLHDICNIYGLTETYGNCHVTDASMPIHSRLRCVGQALPGNRTKICDAESGASLPIGEVGEIRIKGRILHSYFKDTEATRQAMDEEGYFRTGDLGYEDASGHLYFKGRLKELIKSGGMNVSPVEVEEAILRHQAVIAAYCVGIQGDDPQEVDVAAVVVLKPGETVRAEALQALCAVDLARYKRPKKILFVAEHQIPLTTTGKVKKNEIAQLFHTVN